MNSYGEAGCIAIICNEKKEIDVDALNLISGGAVEELCYCNYENSNGCHYLLYPTENMVSLTAMELTKEEIIGILRSALRLIGQLQNNDLSIDNIKTAKDYIFCEEGKYRFIYLPLVQKKRLSIRDFLLKLVSVVRIRDKQISRLIRDIRHNKDDETAIECIKSFLCDSATPAFKTIFEGKDISEGETSLLSDEGETSLLSGRSGNRLRQNRDSSFEASRSDMGFIGSESETTTLGESGSDERVGDDEGYTTLFQNTKTGYVDTSSEYETTVLSSESAAEKRISVNKVNNGLFLVLCRSSTGERIHVDVTPFTIGKEHNSMDYSFNNESVSRRHATIIYENGSYFIIDNNSTNGTLIEGIRLQPNEKAELTNACIISLANEAFQAYIERR